jgi:hypothetical protein
MPGIKTDTTKKKGKEEGAWRILFYHRSGDHSITLTG